MNIITIYGKTKSGKSTSIRWAIIKLMSNGFKIVYNSKKYKHDNLESGIKSGFITNKKYVGQITCCGYINGRKICITTYGDSFKYDILPAINKGREIMGKIDLFVCCSHGKGTDELRKVENTGFIVMKKEKSQNKETFEKDNKSFGNEVVKAILND